MPEYVVDLDGDDQFCVAVTAASRSEAADKGRSFARSRWQFSEVSIASVEPYDPDEGCDVDLRRESDPELQ